MPKRKRFDKGPQSDETSVKITQTDEGPRKPITVTIPEKLAEKARDVAYHEPGKTVSGLVEAGLREVLADYDVPPRPDGEQLPSGPPPSS